LIEIKILNKCFTKQDPYSHVPGYALPIN
jgi:hypothetical protein